MSLTEGQDLSAAMQNALCCHFISIDFLDQRLSQGCDYDGNPSNFAYPQRRLWERKPRTIDTRTAVFLVSH